MPLGDWQWAVTYILQDLEPCMNTTQLLLLSLTLTAMVLLIVQNHHLEMA